MLKRYNTQKAVLILLEDLGPSTTAEIIEEAVSMGTKECRDRVPSALIKLQKEKKVKKTISKEKKAIVWELVDD